MAVEDAVSSNSPYGEKYPSYIQLYTQGKWKREISLILATIVSF